jgi:hypothetical protein
MSPYQKKVSKIDLRGSLFLIFPLVPNGTVKSVTAVPRDSTSVLIEYTKPVEATINGQLIGYDINYALNYPNLNWKSIRVSPATQAFILKGTVISDKTGWVVTPCLI